MKRNILVATFIASAIVSGTYALTPSPVSALSIDDIQAQIKTLLAKIADLTQQMNSLQGQGDTSAGTSTSVVPGANYRICALLSRNLSAGARGDDVASLQEFLSAQGYLSANATGYFGPLTASALARWQASQGVASVGAVGPLTRERIKMWCGGVGGGSGGNFSASPSSGTAPLTVNFTYQPKQESGQYYIEFGDGQGQLMDTQQIYCIRAPCVSPSVASHTYTSGGTYTATVSTYIACLYSNPRCMIAQPPPLAQATVIVRGAGGGAPVISGFSGPTTLAANAVGTWTIQASDPENGQLTYQIWWGDENIYAPGMNIAVGAREFVQTTTFTHSYAYAGIYTVSITVRDAGSNEAKASATVQVGPSPVACTMQYDPVCGQPPEPACRHSIPACMIATPGPQTYGNRCMLNAAGATFLYEGECYNSPVACPADAMLCPDGTTAGRSGPNCQFLCPGF
ncbi:peptidoglycan-binding protein [Candidatus Kaiserbacteria bacterium]|nr:peptidoglycan-binding protein [Candidatus Kaiserbacteria bacterium]